jgi:valyl-tRNA synthetase
MLAPVVPHVAEEIYAAMYADAKGVASLQLTAWPAFNVAAVNEEAERNGDRVVEVIGEVRREKAENRMSLNTPVKSLIIYAGDSATAKAIEAAESDIIGALKVEGCLQVVPTDGDGRQLTQFPSIRFQAEYQPLPPKQ